MVSLFAIKDELMTPQLLINDELMVPMKLKVCQLMIWHKLKYELITIFVIVCQFKTFIFLCFNLSPCQLVINFNFN
jgi:hypothetical protein